MPAKGVSPILEPEKRGLSTLKTSQKRGLKIKIWSKGVSPKKNFRGPFGPPKRGLLNLEKGGSTRYLIPSLGTSSSIHDTMIAMQ